MEIKVLDSGYVRYIDHMGTDITPAESARMSYGTAARGWDNGDGRLIERLLRDRHTSTFEFNEIAFEIQAPIFVARQMVRHRTANWSEFSMRYADANKLGLEIYTPEQWRANTSLTNRQSSGLSPYLDSATIGARYRHACNELRGAYNDLIVAGVAREQARLILPVATYTKWRWKMDFHNLSHFLNLRLAEDAQWETQQYAQAIKSITATVWPRLMALYDG